MGEETEKLRFEILLSFNYMDTVTEEISIAENDLHLIDSYKKSINDVNEVSMGLINRNNVTHIKRCSLSQLYPDILEYKHIGGENSFIDAIVDVSTKAFQYAQKGYDIVKDPIRDGVKTAKITYDSVEYIIQEKRSILHLLKNTLNSVRISVIGKIRKYSQEIEFSLRGVDYQVSDIIKDIKNLHISYPNDKLSKYVSSDRIERLKLISKSHRFIYGNDKSLVSVTNDKLIKAMALANSAASDGFMRFVYDEYMSKVGDKIGGIVDNEAFAKLPLFYGEPIIKELLKDRRTNIHIIDIEGTEVTFFIAGHIRMSNEQRVRRIFTVKVPDYRDSWEPVIGDTGELLELLNRSLTVLKNFKDIIDNSYSLINDMEKRFENIDKAAGETSNNELRVQAKNADKAFNVSAYVAFKRVDMVYRNIKDSIKISEVTIGAARASNEK